MPRYITFNDDVAAGEYPLPADGLPVARRRSGCGRAILRGDERLPRHPAADAAARLEPAAHARPQARRARAATSRCALATHTTAANLRQLMSILPADRRRSASSPASPRRSTGSNRSACRPTRRARGRDFPTFIELGTNRPRYVHRRGSNVVNGRYYWDYSPAATLGHYRRFASDRHRGAAARISRRCGRRRARRSCAIRRCCAPGRAPLPRFMTSTRRRLRPQRRRRRRRRRGDPQRSTPKAGGRRRCARPATPIAAHGPRRPPPGDFRTTHVGDASDTSPYTTDRPVIGISTATYIANMALLIRALPRPVQR